MARKKIIKIGAIVFPLLTIAGPARAECYVNYQEVACDVLWAQYGWIFVAGFLIPGLFFLIKPDWHIKFMIWSQKVFMGAKFIPSRKTETIVRLVGAVFAILGLVFLYLTIIHQ